MPECPDFISDSAECALPLGISVLGSGSKGNCTLIHRGTDAIMIDAGFSWKETKKRMEECGLGNLAVHAILVTHEHSDHVGGLRICSQKLGAPVFATARCAETLRYKYPALTRITTFVPGDAFAVGSFRISPFSIPHDANDPVAFVVRNGARKVAVATDIGKITAGVEFALQECHALVLESNHDLEMLAASDRSWSLKQRIMGPQGHLSNVTCGDLLARVLADFTKNIILAHLSGECNTSELAEQNARRVLGELGRKDIDLQIAAQSHPLPTIWIS